MSIGGGSKGGARYATATQVVDIYGGWEALGRQDLARITDNCPPHYTGPRLMVVDGEVVRTIEQQEAHVHALRQRQGIR